MKKLLTLVFLLVGLVGFTQTNSHQQMTGTIHTTGLNFIPSNNDIQILLYEVDTFGVARPYVLGNYTTALQNNRYVISFILPPTNPVVVYVKLLPGSRLYGKYVSTFGRSSTSINSATRAIIPYTPPGTTATANCDVYMIPDISWRSNLRHTE